MRKNFMVLAGVIGWSSLGFAQYVSFSMASNGTNSIPIPPGEVWQVANYYWSRIGGPLEAEGILIYPSSSAPSGAWIGKLPVDGGTSTSNARDGACIVGPAEIRITSSVGNYLLVFKKIINDANSLVSANAVVIPQTSATDVDIKLEQSADNVTWTECLPGTYNSSTVKRFFRLRAVEK